MNQKFSSFETLIQTLIPGDSGYDIITFSIGMEMD